MQTISAEPFVPPTVGELVRVFAKIGLISFGGPAGQIALMHRVLVEEKKWLDEPRFLHALNYCMMLPGPEAMQLATYAGWLMHGVRGGLIAGLLFVMPGAIVLLALSALYLALGEVTIVEGLLFGLKAAVLAIVLEALVKVSKRALKSTLMVVIAIVAFIGIAFLQIPFPVIILSAAAIGAMVHWLMPAAPQTNPESRQARPPQGEASIGRFVSTTAVWGAIWLVPLVLLALVLGLQHVYTLQAGFFSVMAALTFGGAYAVLAWVAQQAVEVYGWLRPEEMLTGLGLAETTPGPLILVLLFVGFLGGARLSGLEPFAGGIGGALVALWFTFVPCFLWIFAGAPYVEKLRDVKWLSAALTAVTAAVVGVIANLALWFGLHVLFARLDAESAGPLRVLVPDPASFDPAAGAIALTAALSLMVLKLNLFLVLGGAALAGMGWLLLA